MHYQTVNISLENSTRMWTGNDRPEQMLRWAVESSSLWTDYLPAGKARTWLKDQRMERNIQGHVFCSYHQAGLVAGLSPPTHYTKYITNLANSRTGFSSLLILFHNYVWSCYVFSSGFYSVKISQGQKQKSFKQKLKSISSDAIQCGTFRDFGKSYARVLTYMYFSSLKLSTGKVNKTT